MLPLPASSTPPRLRTRLHARARLSNAGLLLILSSLTVSFIFNVRYYISRPASGLRPFAVPTHDHHIRSLTHLVIVPGHAIWVGTDPNLRLSEDQWLLEPYQKGQGRLAAFFAHISRGVELAMSDEHALLIFSGGQTKKASTTTEAESYLRLALYGNLLGASESPTADYTRATTENFALDSYQNLLFSIARFREYTGRFPENITVVGYEFKRERFINLHRAAIRWPLDRFRYVGVDADDGTSHDAQQGERENGYKPFSRDPYGCHTFLASKRRQRNPHSRFHPYYSSTAEFATLLDWCPDNVDGSSSTTFSGALPWDQFGP